MSIAFVFASTDSMRMWAIVLTLGSTCCTATKIMLLQSHLEREHSRDSQTWDFSSQSDSMVESCSTEFGSSETEATIQ